MSDQHKGNKKIATNTIVLYIRMGFTMLISFYTTRVTLEVLGVEDFGLNNVVASVVSMFSFINGSMGTAVQRFFSVSIGSNNRDDLSKIFGVSLYLHIIVAIITLIISEIFAIFFLSGLNIPQERLFAAHVVFQISVFSLIANIINVPYSALLRAHEDFSKIAIIDIIQAILKLGILFLLLRINYDKIIVLSSLNLLVTLVYLLVITSFAKKYKEAKFQIIRDKAVIKEMLSFISLLIFTVLASLFNRQGVIIAVNIFFGLTINAAYAIAFQVSNLIETFAMNFKQSVVPQLMQAHGANDSKRMNQLLYLGTKIGFLLMMLFSIPFVFETDYILKLWLKNPPEYASEFTKLIVIGVNIDTFYYFMYQSVHASGNIKKQQVLTSISYLLSIFAVFISFYFGFNFYFAAYIPIVFSIIRNFISLYSAVHTIEFDYKKYFIEIFLPCFIFLVFLIVISGIITVSMEISFIRFIILISANCILSLLLGYIILFNKNERTAIKKLFVSYA